MSDTDKFTDQQILARTIWGEARNQSLLGQQAIGCVVLNRAKLGGWWGHDIRSVCLKPYQFSSWNDNDPNRPKMIALLDADCQPMMDIAQDAIDGNLADVVNGADSYEVTGTNAFWGKNLTPVAVIGAHSFYITK